MKKGNLSVNSENIMPIIKKWLYSDSDIFVRELVSNGCDAIAKLARIVSQGEFETADEFRVDVSIDKESKTIKFIDNGIGMTEEEVEKYINQIAFSGANEFAEKYKDSKADIIGHFGLGFYSAFMVSTRVTIDTLSYLPDAAPVFWESDGSAEFEITESKKTSRGTEITLYVNEDGEKFLEEYELSRVLKKYCGFMPYPIFLNAGSKEEKEEKDSKKSKKDSKDSTEQKIQPVNDVSPLWLKKPSDCTDDDYKKFYRETFHDFSEPLFWMHLNMDYPFNLKGILYFPKLKHELESIEGEVKLYNNQVFIADNIKEVLPEFLLLLKGAIDCPDLPLNVSRSFLQNDANVAKTSTYIVRKVGDKLNSVCKNNREQYESYWEDINQFIKYGCVKDEEFYKKIRESILYKTIDGKHVNITDLEDNIYYVTNEVQQSQYIKLFKETGKTAVELPTRLDAPFISYVELYEKDRKIKFLRIDSGTGDIKEDGKVEKKERKALEKLFKEALGNDKLKISVEILKSAEVPALITLSEESRRMKEMMRTFGGKEDFGYGDEETLVLNANNNLIKILAEKSKSEDAELLCRHIYDLALLSHRPLDAEAMSRFIERSHKISEKILSA